VREVVRRAVRPRPSRCAARARPAADAPAGQEAEPVDAAVLLRPLERELEPEADAEHRPLLGDALAERVVEALRAELVHRRARRADAGQHREVGAGDVVDDSAPSRRSAISTERMFPAR
jgi:hypothetical protein